MAHKWLLATLAVCVSALAAPPAERYAWDSVAIGGGGFVSAVIPDKPHQRRRSGIHRRADPGKHSPYDGFRVSVSLRPE